jgi:hypothetical protein
METTKTTSSTDFEEERADFYRQSNQNLNRAFGDDEPTYTEEDFLEINPNFSNPQVLHDELMKE